MIFVILQNGLYIDSISLPNIKIKQLYIKWNEKLNISFRYSGKINENTHFIDLNLETFEDNFSMEFFRLRKRFAYLQDNFVLLTSESLWYPISGTTYAPSRPAIYLPDFTKFSLKVKTASNLTPVSQGLVTKISDSETQFTPEFALPKLSLLIADYKKYTVDVNGIEYSLYTKKSNEYFEEHFVEIEDSIPQLIRDLQNEYETFIGFKYPFKRFALAEVPVQFALDKHIWSIASDAVQPEMIFYSEKDVKIVLFPSCRIFPFNNLSNHFNIHGIAVYEKCFFSPAVKFFCFVIYSVLIKLYTVKNLMTREEKKNLGNGCSVISLS